MTQNPTTVPTGREHTVAILPSLHAGHPLSGTQRLLVLSPPPNPDEVLSKDQPTFTKHPQTVRQV